MGKISVLVLKEDKLPFESIFNIFSNNKYDICSYKEDHDRVLFELYEKVKNAIIVNKISAKKISINIYGENVDQKFDISELPSQDIIER